MKIINFLKNNFWQVLLIATLVILAYGLTLKMYYWIDDWGLVYKMIFPQNMPTPSNFGAGIFGQGAYRYNSTLFTWMYPLFGLNEKIYYALGLVQYFFTSIFIYLLVNKLAKRKDLGLIAAIIFSSGFFGSRALYRLSNSYQLIETALFLIAIIFTLVKYYESKQIKYYFWSLILFILGVELMFLRAHGMFPTVFAAAIIYGIFKYKRKIGTTFIQLIPFSLIYYFFYFIDKRSGVLMTDSSTVPFLNRFISICISQPMTAFSNFLVSYVNLLIPNPLISDMHKFLNLGPRLSLFDFSFVVGLIVFAVIICLIYKFRKDKEKISLMIFGLLWILSNFIIYILYDPIHDLDSNVRYFIPPAVGTAIFYAGFFSLFKNKILKYLLIILFSGTLIFYSRVEQNLVVKYVSVPDKQGYELLLDEVKSINKDTLFLFDVIDDPRYLNNLFGGTPQMGIPPLYKKSWEAIVANDVKDFIKRMVDGTSSVDNFESFFYGIGGHIYTTNEVRNLLKNGGDLLVLKNPIKRDKKIIEYTLDYPSFVPTLMTIKLNKSVYVDKIKIWWMTEKRDIYTEDYSQEINLYGNTNVDNIIIPAGGRRLRSIQIDLGGNSSNVIVDYATVRGLSLDALKKMNYQP